MTSLRIQLSLVHSIGKFLLGQCQSCWPYFQIHPMCVDLELSLPPPCHMLDIFTSANPHQSQKEGDLIPVFQMKKFEAQAN